MKSDRPMPIQPIPAEAFTPAMRAFAPPGSTHEQLTWAGILGKAGPLADLLLPYYSATIEQNALGPKLTELVRIACATTTRCEACMIYRDPRVEDQIQPDVLTLLDEFESAPGFSDRERAAIRFALAFGTNHHAIDDAMWDDLKSLFDDQEILHLALFVAHFVGMGRLGHAMRLIDAHCTLPGYRLAELIDTQSAPEPVGAA